MQRRHDSPAAKQAAYRARQKERREAASAGWTDAELGQAARDLHVSIECAAREGD